MVTLSVANRSAAIPEAASTAEAFEGLLGEEYKSLARTIFAFRRGPIRYRRDQTIVIEGEVSEYIFLVISGVVRSFRSFQNGGRIIVDFYFPTEFFGLTNRATHSFTAEAAAKANILFFKRSALFSMKSEAPIANFLLNATLTELRRSQDNSLMLTKDAKTRVAAFLVGLSKRMGTQTRLDFPMSHQDIADHLGLTIETLSRTITLLENGGLIERGGSPRDLVLLNPDALADMAN